LPSREPLAGRLGVRAPQQGAIGALDEQRSLVGFDEAGAYYPPSGQSGAHGRGTVHSLPRRPGFGEIAGTGGQAIVTREQSRLPSKLRPTGTSATDVPSRSAASAMRAAPVRSGSSRPVEWLMPSGKMQMASPADSAARRRRASRRSSTCRRLVDPAIDGDGAGAERRSSGPMKSVDPGT
jgi:hypothetical protein